MSEFSLCVLTALVPSSAQHKHKADLQSDCGNIFLRREDRATRFASHRQARSQLGSLHTLTGECRPLGWWQPPGLSGNRQAGREEHETVNNISGVMIGLLIGLSYENLSNQTQTQTDS